MPRPSILACPQRHPTGRPGQPLLTVNSGGLVVEVRDAWRTCETRIAAADILAIDYGTADAAVDAARRAAVQKAIPRVEIRCSPSLGGDRMTPRWLRTLARFAQSKGITVKGKGGLVTFGVGLTDEEVRYLYSIIKRALAGPAASRW